MLLSIVSFAMGCLLQALARSGRDDLEREVELLLLTHQLKVLSRGARRPPLRRRDRMMLAAASRFLARDRSRGVRRDAPDPTPVARRQPVPRRSAALRRSRTCGSSTPTASSLPCPYRSRVEGAPSRRTRRRRALRLRDEGSSRLPLACLAATAAPNQREAVDMTHGDRTVPCRLSRPAVRGHRGGRSDANPRKQAGTH
jgi:hypothetical protein